MINKRFFSLLTVIAWWCTAAAQMSVASDDDPSPVAHNNSAPPAFEFNYMKRLPSKDDPESGAAAQFIVSQLWQAARLLTTPDMVISTVRPKNQDKEVIFVGDIHGQSADLRYMLFDQALKLEQRLRDGAHVVFLGDLVDRGKEGCEVLMTLIDLLTRFPKQITMIRGNHENLLINAKYGFLNNEIQTRYRSRIRDIADALTAFYRSLRLAAFIEYRGKRYYAAHGGLPIYIDRDDNGIVKSYAFADPATPLTVKILDSLAGAQEDPAMFHLRRDDATILMLLQLLWGDPAKGINPGQSQLFPSPARGGTDFYAYGPEVTRAFINQFNLAHIIRAHQPPQEGYEFLHDDRVLTVFSACDYCEKKNKAAIVILNPDGNFEAHTWDSKASESFQTGAEEKNVPDSLSTDG